MCVITAAESKRITFSKVSNLLWAWVPKEEEEAAVVRLLDTLTPDQRKKGASPTPGRAVLRENKYTWCGLRKPRAGWQKRQDVIILYLYCTRTLNQGGIAVEVTHINQSTGM